MHYFTLLFIGGGTRTWQARFVSSKSLTNLSRDCSTETWANWTPVLVVKGGDGIFRGGSHFYGIRELSVELCNIFPLTSVINSSNIVSDV